MTFKYVCNQASFFPLSCPASPSSQPICTPTQRSVFLSVADLLHMSTPQVDLFLCTLIAYQWGLSIFSQLMLIAFNRWKCNKTTSILFCDILLPVLPNVWSVQRIHLKKGSQTCVLSLGISTNIKLKKKKNVEDSFFCKNNMGMFCFSTFESSVPDELW